MGLGTELPLLLALGFVVLGPKRMQTMLGHAARAKAEFHKAICGIKSKPKARCRTAEIIMRLTAQRAIARVVYRK